MQVGIIGTGDVGGNLATGLSAAGHDVVVGSRTPDQVTGWGPGDIPVRSHEAAIETAELVILAVPSDVAHDLARTWAPAFTGMILVDPTNEYPSPTADVSVAERIADAAPDARVAKAFNTVGAEHMSDPVVGDHAASMLIAGEGDATGPVASLAADIGFEPVIVGDLEAAARLEDLGRLWIDLSIEHGRNVAFRLLSG